MSTQLPNIAALGGLRSDVAAAIRQASAQTGVDFAYLLEKASVESSFDPQAQAETSSARGLYQFVDRTWLDVMDRHGAAHGYPNVAKAITRDADGKPVVANAAAQEYILALRDNPRISALMAAEFTQDNKVALEHELGREVGNVELYLAHFLGAGGAAKFIDALHVDGTRDAAELLPEAAKANQAVFFDGGRALSLDQVFARFDAQFGDRAHAHPTPKVELAAHETQAAIFAASLPAVAAEPERQIPAPPPRTAFRADLALQLITIQAFTNQQQPETGGWIA